MVPSRSWITTTDTTTSTITASTRKARSLPKSIGPSSGRGTRVPVSSAVDPPPTHENLTITASKKKANASVAMASHTPAQAQHRQRQHRSDCGGHGRTH